ncbi:MAG: metallophosphoesterase [Ignavibacteriae bacterium]|nr:metallophosphoesterase [Ignavibacteriota bacterium]
MKILHLSDLHLNPIYHKNNIEKTRLALTQASIDEFDHLIITGDIAHDADEESFKIFREILKEFNLLDSRKTTVIIGNHDIFGGVYSVKDLLNFPERCKSTNYSDQVLRFVNYFEELFTDCIFPDEKNIFPFVKILDDVALIGINTNDIYSVIKNPFASNGKVSKNEYKYLKLILEDSGIDNKKKIVLSHHHFYKNNFEAKSSTNDLWNKIEGYTLKLRGKKKLLKLFVKNNIDAILHGHSHENKIYSRLGINIFNAGGSIDNEDKNLFCLNYFNTETMEITSKRSELQLTE